MKIVSLNVAFSEKNNDKLANFIRDQKADFLCLQEVTKGIDSSANPDLISKDTIDRESADLPESFFGPIWVLSKFEKNNFHQKEHFITDLGGKVEFGNYTKSRYPIIKGQNIFVQNHFSYMTDWSRWPEEDCRAFQVNDIIVDGRHLRVINYHGIWTQDKKGSDMTKNACESIKNAVLETEYPTIICGDFNLFPDTESIRILSKQLESLVDTFNIHTTRPSSNELRNQPRNVVDYIFTNRHVKIHNFQVLKNDVSDHFPLILDFSI